MSKPQIQSVYPGEQERGQVGALSRPSNPYTADIITIGANGAGLRPGDAFKVVANLAVKLTNLADSVNAEGIILFEYGTVNQDLVGGVQNAQGIEYAEGDIVKYLKTGDAFVIAGGELDLGEEVGFDPADHTWKAATNDLRSMRATRYVAADGDVMEVTLGSYLSTGDVSALEARVLALDEAGTGAMDVVEARVDILEGFIAADAEFVIGVESGGNVVNVGVTMVDANDDPIAEVQNVQVLLSDDIAGLGIAATAPDGGIAAGADGAILMAMVAGKMLLVQTEATGKFDLDITESGTDTFYMVVILPNGRQIVSDAISFVA